MSVAAATHEFRLTPAERRAVLGLGALYALRMLGTFLVLPVMSLHVAQLRGATPLLVGLSLGAYGLAQGVLQIPLGAWSDRFGRRPVLIVGLLVFAAGSFIAARAETAWTLVLGRGVLGLGAIAAIIVALVGDLTRPSVRARAMSALGIAVGVAWAGGMALGPTVAALVGVPALFAFTGACGTLGALAVLLVMRRPPSAATTRAEEWRRADLRTLLRHGALWSLNAGVFVLHTSITAMFVIVPPLMVQHVPLARHGLVYAPVVLWGLALVTWSARVAERRGRLREAVLLGAGALAAGQACLFSAGHTLPGVAAAVALAVAAIAIAQPSMLALMTQHAPANARGTAAGMFHLCEFMGSFVGGLTGGALLRHPSTLGGVLLACALVWAALSARLPRPPAPAAPPPAP